ncbi:MAG: CDP-diacylglycerol--glycerol-3-phosphate 3-phosphatidyltransferase [Puniceicoccales bacterium]|nr:CDP-diacylglycerol--glycerol-3-phosphate 3-phosphatidyltransferase [Puniceicoccales bacterium]
MNIANCVTLSRVPSLFIVVALLYIDVRFTSTVSLFVFIFASWTDWLDGYLARRCGMVSNFGKFMDALMDKIFMVGLFVSMLALNILPRWTLFLVLLVIGREFLVTGLRLIASSDGIVIAANRLGKIKTVIQIVSVGVLIIWKALASDWALAIPKLVMDFFYYSGLILFLIATALTLISGISYLTKYKNVFNLD